MEIIKRGMLPSDKTYEGTCIRCHTEVRFKQSEGTVVFDQRDGNAVKVTCPVCGNEIWVAK